MSEPQFYKRNHPASGNDCTQQYCVTGNSTTGTPVSPQPKPADGVGCNRVCSSSSWSGIKQRKRIERVLPLSLCLHYGQGGRPGRIQTPNPPPPSRPPKVLEPVFLKFENLGETAGATRAGNFFGGLPEGKKLFFTLCVCTQNTKNFVENAKLVENQKNNFGLPTQPPGWTLADGGTLS